MNFDIIMVQICMKNNRTKEDADISTNFSESRKPRINLGHCVNPKLNSCRMPSIEEPMPGTAAISFGLVAGARSCSAIGAARSMPPSLTLSHEHVLPFY